MIHWRGCAPALPPTLPRQPLETVAQGIGFAAPDGALQGGQVFGKATENVEHRILVVKEDIAPHHRVRRGDAGEVAETTGGEFDHFLFQRETDHLIMYNDAGICWPSRHH